MNKKVMFSSKNGGLSPMLVKGGSMSSYKTNNTPEYLAKLRASVGRSARLAKSILETQLHFQHDFDNPKMDDDGAVPETAKCQNFYTPEINGQPQKRQKCHSYPPNLP